MGALIPQLKYLMSESDGLAAVKLAVRLSHLQIDKLTDLDTNAQKILCALAIHLDRDDVWIESGKPDDKGSFDLFEEGGDESF